MRNFLGLLVVLFLIIFFALWQKMGDMSPAKSQKPEIEFTDLGINLYGKFRFESEGELFDIIDNDSTILISAGAVFTCIRRTYTIGYFGGGATISEKGNSRVIPKVFFVLKPSGEITYHYPSSDGNFPGKQLLGSVKFGKLYDPQKNQEAEQDGAL